MKHIQNLQKLFSKNFVESPVIETFDAGKLVITSGKLVICDPILTNDMEAFYDDFPIGKFPVLVHIDFESGSFAYIEVQFSENVASDWKNAAIPSQKKNTLKKGEIFGFPVQSGIASIMDFDTQTQLNELENAIYTEKKENFLGIYEEFFKFGFEGLDGQFSPFSFFKPSKTSEGNIFAFDAGTDQGFFGTYIGTDKNGEICKLIIELMEIIADEN